MCLTISLSLVHFDLPKTPSNITYLTIPPDTNSNEITGNDVFILLTQLQVCCRFPLGFVISPESTG